MGFSRVGTLGGFLGVGALLEALRIVNKVKDEVVTRVRHMAPLCGRRNRGMGVVGGIVLLLPVLVAMCYPKLRS